MKAYLENCHTCTGVDGSLHFDGERIDHSGNEKHQSNHRWDPSLLIGIYLSQFGNWDPRHNLSLQTGIEYRYMYATQDVIEEIASA